jgi:hypothetical protein
MAMLIARSWKKPYNALEVIHETIPELLFAESSPSDILLHTVIE